jgi:hypothetical protein
MNVDHLDDAQLALRPHRITGPVMAAFLDAAAIQPAAALRYTPATAAAEKEFARLYQQGVLRAHQGGHWFDLRRHYAVRRKREIEGMIASVAGALAIAAVAVMLY